jgi:hypothetical protein
MKGLTTLVQKEWHCKRSDNAGRVMKVVQVKQCNNARKVTKQHEKNYVIMWEEQHGLRNG